MALSTTMPTAKAMPAKETILIDRPSATKTTTDAITEIGIAMAITPMVLSERKNNNKVNTANMPPTTILLCTSSMAFST